VASEAVVPVVAASRTVVAEVAVAVEALA